MSGIRFGRLLVLVLSLSVLPAMAAQSCNDNAKATAPGSRFIDPGAGIVQCWGLNTYGQLGDGTAVSSSSPVSVVGIHNALAIGGGNSHSCSLLLDGSVQCWGFNANGQLGNGTTTDSYIPVVVSGIGTVTALAVGGEHTCARLANGTVQCWGRNTHGQLGDNSMTDSATPVAVNGITTATAVAAGDAHSCAVLVDGTVWCWGFNDSGQLGTGNTTPSIVPVQVSGITNATAIAAGDNHTCARLDDGTVVCWGSNSNGQVGNGSSTPTFKTPRVVSGLTTAVSITAGSAHNCARLSDDSVECWGLNNHGQLGDATVADHSVPVAVSGISHAEEVSAGGNHSCARVAISSASSIVQCWGENGDGQLGNARTNDSPVPVTVTGITGGASGDATAIATGSKHSCARISTNTGTIVDTSTGLMWKRCSEGQAWDRVNQVCVGSLATYTWQDALTRARLVNLPSTDPNKQGEDLGYFDWRLPNRNELASLVEYQCNNPAVNTTVFPGMVAQPYWSSSPNAADSQQAWVVDMNAGRVSGAPKTDSYNAHLVRGGK
jgi:alpha-tubulin suppressor-like RCC1 family protein